MRFCFCFVLLLPLLLHGKIIETDSMESILEYAQNDTMVFIDIDNTLIESETHMGSSQWSDHWGVLFTVPGRSYDEIDAMVSEMWTQVQPLIKIRTVDPKTEKVFNALHEEDKIVFGLTARHPREIHYTLDQLNAVKLSFSETMDCVLEKNITVKQGVIFCGTFNKKSEGLKAFLKEYGKCPKRIVFIDDKLSHVEDVGNFVENLGLEYVGIRFSGADARVLSFCPHLAAIQFKHLPKILTDEEAELILKSK